MSFEQTDGGIVENGTQAAEQHDAQNPQVRPNPAQSGAEGVLSKGPSLVSSLSRNVTEQSDQVAVGVDASTTKRRSSNQPPISTSRASFQTMNPSFGGASYVGPSFKVGDRTDDGVTIESSYDALSEQKFDSMYQRVSELNEAVTRLNREIGAFTTRIQGSELIGGELGRFKAECEQLEVARRQMMQGLDGEQNALARQLSLQANELEAIRNHLYMASANIEEQLKELREEITSEVAAYTEACKSLEAEQVSKKPIEDEIRRLSGVIDEKAREYLALKVDQAPSPIAQIGELQMQLLEITRKKLTSQAPATRWSALTGMFSTNKEMAALRSVQRFSKNAAFSKLEQRNDAELNVNIELLGLMRSATFALTYFNQNHTSTAAAGASVTAVATSSSSTGPVPTTTSPARSAVSASADALATPSRQTTDEANVVNKAVLMAVREDLRQAQGRADGLIGSQNPSRQFWGKVLMALALAIAATVAAIALMSTLGFALPTFLVPYVAYVQASAIVSSVLNLVSTKLAIDLTAAAAVTAVSTAGAFGVFGYGLNRSGAPTSLKRDLDRAAQDLDAAISDTPAMRASR